MAAPGAVPFGDFLRAANERDRAADTAVTPVRAPDVFVHQNAGAGHTASGQPRIGDVAPIAASDLQPQREVLREYVRVPLDPIGRLIDAVI